MLSYPFVLWVIGYFISVESLRPKFDEAVLLFCVHFGYGRRKQFDLSFLEATIVIVSVVDSHADPVPVRRDVLEQGFGVHPAYAIQAQNLLAEHS